MFCMWVLLPEYGEKSTLPKCDTSHLSHSLILDMDHSPPDNLISVRRVDLDDYLKSRQLISRRIAPEKMNHYQIEKNKAREELCEALTAKRKFQ